MTGRPSQIRASGVCLLFCSFDGVLVSGRGPRSVGQSVFFVR